MSEREFVAYLSGETLRNTVDHSQHGERSTSVGFCFFTEDPDDAIHWLRGIVTDDVCCTFEVPADKVRKTSGTYCDHSKTDNSWGALLEDMLAMIEGREMPNVVKIERTEYCCTEYSSKDFRLVDYKYSQLLTFCQQADAEWYRPQEPPLLLRGTVTDRNILWVAHKIARTLEKTPLHGGMSAEAGEGYCRGRITLPDGRIVVPFQRVAVYADGIVLIDGKLLAAGFPKGTRFCSGTCRGDNHWYLCLRDGSELEVPEVLLKKYREVLNLNNQTCV